MEVIRLSSVDSTNRYALALARQGSDHGTAVVTHEQTGGRGRLGKQWLSVTGKGLFVSYIVRPKLAIADFPKLTMVAGLAVAETIEASYSIQAGLKWPNDIYFGRRKCGGILTESSALGSGSAKPFAVIGLGLNVNVEIEDIPQEIEDRATSLLIESGLEREPDELLVEIRDNILRRLSNFEQAGFGEILAAWKKRDIFLGKRLTWLSVDGEIIEGVSNGPDEDGLLHIRTDDGAIHQILSGDIQLAGKM